MQSQVRANASTDVVWSILADVPSWPEWAKICVSSSIEDSFNWQPGDRLRFKLRMAGVAVPFEVAVTEIETGHRVAWRSTEFTITAVRTITIESEGDGAIATDHKAFHTPVLPIGLAYPRFLIRRMTESWLNDLALEAERRSPA